MAAIRKFYGDMERAAASGRFWMTPLGDIDGQMMWLVRSHFGPTTPLVKILVVAGMHGEEKAGPYAILKWLLEDHHELLQNIEMSFIPIINPIGFAKGTRYGTKTPNNCGFCHPESKETLAPEGEILYRNVDLLRPLAEHGFLSLHEDIDCDSYYVYDYCKGDKPTSTSKAILTELGKHFPKMLTDASVLIDTAWAEIGPKVINGVVWHYCDGSFEDWMYHLGVPKVIVAETPGTYKLSRRIDAHVGVIDKFIKVCLKGKKHEATA